MQKNTNFNDDLIGGGQEPIIIQQGGGNDKKFIYTILILLVVLFIIVLAAVAYFGTKFFTNSNSVTHQAAMQTQAVAVAKPTNQEEKAIAQNVQKAQENTTLAELENVVSNETTQKQKTATKIEQAVNKATGGVKLSPEDLQKIAQLVAQQLAQTTKASKVQTKQTTASEPISDEEALVQSLQAASTDTLAQEDIDTAQVKVNNNQKVQSTSNKKVDTFNKVVVAKNTNTEDEFAKLSQEIDTILQTEDVQKVEKKEEKKLADVIKTRKQELRFIVVRPGDTLSSIARRAYGKASAYIKIYKANPDLIKNPNRIYVGQRLRVPLDGTEEYQGNAR